MGAAPEFNYTGVNRPGDPERLAVDISYLRTLGYEPQVKFADGLAATVDWFQGSG
jgi:UDP-glucose 4-epimerase